MINFASGICEMFRHLTICLHKILPHRGGIIGHLLAFKQNLFAYLENSRFASTKNYFKGNFSDKVVSLFHEL